MSTPPPSSRALREMRELNIDDLLKGLGWQAFARLFPAIRRLFDFPATRLARIVLEFDRQVGEVGLASAALAALPQISVRPHILGKAEAGPCLYLANHPGLSDALCLMQALQRPDLRIIALGRPFLRHLPNVASHLLFLPSGGGGATSLLRQAVDHLRQGGAVLSFPAGTIEPDPAWYPSEATNLASWSASTELFARLVPGLAIQPWAVAGVHHRGLLFHPILKIRRNATDRPWLAAVLQLSLQMLYPGRWPVRVEVRAHPGNLAKNLANDVQEQARQALGRLMQASWRGL